MGATFAEGYPDLLENGIRAYFESASDLGRGLDYSPADALMVERRGWREE